MVAKGIEFSRETYLAILLDQEFNGPVIISSSIGGVGIEELAESNPGCIHKVRNLLKLKYNIYTFFRF